MGKSETPEDADRYLPTWLLPYMPKDPDIRDMIMMAGTISACSWAAAAATFITSGWIPVIAAALAVGHFTIHYLFRVLDRHNPNKG
jgi:CHASE2 domain-containing sensor protein